MCSKSLKYTVIDDTINDIPNNNIYCINNINGYNNKYQESPTGENITNASIIIVEIIKLTAPLVTTDIGNISLGKYTFLIISPLPITVKADCVTAVVKYVHGINATHT